MEIQFICQRCGATCSARGLAYRCQCGGLFALADDYPELPDDAISLGEVATPLLCVESGAHKLHLKMESQQPTGSFKDRGARYLVDHLRRWGIHRVVEDSSGNAASSLAAYCAAAGIHCQLYVPEATSAAKLRQMAIYGADIVKVPGPRDCASEAVKQAAGATYYASHVFNPLFFAGVRSLAGEIVQQVGQVPGSILLPVGHGSLLLGLYQGFRKLDQGMPRLLAVQAANCSPVYQAFHGGPASAVQPTVAEGIAVGAPPRLAEIVQAVDHSGGTILTVDDEKIMEAWHAWARQGIYVEKTAAIVLAAWQQHIALDQVETEAAESCYRAHELGADCAGQGLRPAVIWDEPVVAIMTGSGLKNS